MSRITKLEAFLKQEPDDSFTRYAMGLEYAKEQKLPEAIRTLEDLRERDPKYIPTYYMLASYYRESGQTAKAKATYLEGIEKARLAKDIHTAAELEEALEELLNG